MVKNGSVVRVRCRYDNLKRSGFNNAATLYVSHASPNDLEFETSLASVTNPPSLAMLLARFLYRHDHDEPPNSIA